MREIDERDCQNWMADTQQDELESLRKDAMRYRFLRESRNAYPLCFIAQRDPHNVVVQFTGELADATIDALMVPNNRIYEPCKVDHVPRDQKTR